MLLAVDGSRPVHGCHIVDHHVCTVVVVGDTTLDLELVRNTLQTKWEVVEINQPDTNAIVCSIRSTSGASAESVKQQLQRIGLNVFCANLSELTVVSSSRWTDSKQHLRKW